MDSALVSPLRGLPTLVQASLCWTTRWLLSDMCGRATAVLLLTDQVHLGKFASRTLLLDDGEVKECGTFHELMLAGGAFARLYASEEPAAGEPTAVDHGVARVSKAPLPPHLLCDGEACGAGTACSIADVTWVDECRKAPGGSHRAQGLFSTVAHEEISCHCGAVLTVCIVCAPLSSFAANVFLIAWVVESIGTEPLQQRFQLTVYLSAGALFAALSFERVTCCLGVLPAHVDQTPRAHDCLCAPAEDGVVRHHAAWPNLESMLTGRDAGGPAAPWGYGLCAQYVGVVFVGVCGAAVLVWPSLVLTIPMFVFLYVVLQDYGTLAVDLPRLMLEMNERSDFPGDELFDSNGHGQSLRES